MSDHDAKWIERMRAEAQAEARAECDRCQGRVVGDCSDECRYYRLTATQREAELAQVAAVAVEVRDARREREWLGAVQPETLGEGEAA